ncbi:MAG: glycosyltransferase family 4 protein [Candidatus Polarisedimenticolaceae bacterium]|nr:glycosyltransferase family 4 protein [Candidatus Polarisedimenticolaceae bacterium]
MKLAFVVSLWFPFGGMQRSLLRIAQTCVARGHKVDIFTGEWQGERPADIGVFELDTKASTNHRSNDLLAERFAEAIAGQGYDCRVGFTKLPGLDVYYAADPCYAARVEETKPAIYRISSRYRVFKRQERAVFQPGTQTEVMLIAHQEQVKFIKHYGTEPERFHLLPPGINRQRLMANGPEDDRRVLREAFGISEQEWLLLLVGSRFHTKGVDRVVRSLATLPAEQRARCRLLVVGHGKDGPFRRLAKRLGVAGQIIFTGTREDVPRFYRAADVLIHAPRNENTGTVLIEAMICGLPVLVTANCGFAFHVRDADAGMVVPDPFDQGRLDRGLAAFLASPQREAWVGNGPAYCERTDLYSLIERAADVIITRAERNQEVVC